MANSKKTPAFLGLNLGLVGSAFYYYLKGIPVATLAIVIPVTALIFNALVWRAESKRSGGEGPAKDL